MDPISKRFMQKLEAFAKQLIEAVGPDVGNEAEQAKGGRGEHEKDDHPQRMSDAHWHKKFDVARMTSPRKTDLVAAAPP